MRLSEIYTSIQGEGPHVGEPTTFVRFGGCNLRCAGWGEGLLPDGTTVPGCDTVFAVYPEWRDTWKALTPEQVAEGVPKSPKRLCITGGEPLLQRHTEMAEFITILLNRGHVLDLFTNGTRLLPKWARDPRVTVIMDWKLAGSKEADSFEKANLNHLKFGDAIKFVCKDVVDFEEALLHIKINDLDSNPADIYFGPVWNEMDPDHLVHLVNVNYPKGKLNIQTHKYIFGDVRGT